MATTRRTATTPITLYGATEDIAREASWGRDVFTLENASRLASFFESEAYDADNERRREVACSLWVCHRAADRIAQYIRDHGTGTDMVTRIIRAAFNAFARQLPFACPANLSEMGCILEEVADEIYTTRHA